MTASVGVRLVMEVVKKNKVAIFTSASCPYCYKAKDLLDQLGVKYTDVAIDTEPSQSIQDIRLQIQKMSGQRTVPQIFINQASVGGFSDLQMAHSNGTLAKLLVEKI
eukprot:CFRG7718T1